MPVILYLFFKNLAELELIAKTHRDDFSDAFHVVFCARRDVYDRNIQDAVLFLKDKFPDLNADPEALLVGTETECEGVQYEVYRETNEELVLLHPNWTYLETIRPADDG